MKKCAAIPLILLMTLCFLLGEPGAADAGLTSEQMHERAGKGILFGLQRIFLVINQAGQGEFQVKLSSTAFSEGNTRLKLVIGGNLNVIGWTAKYWIAKLFPTEMPLPPRPECRGFLKVHLPEGLSGIADAAVVNLGFTVTLEVKVDECIRMIGMAVVGSGLSRVGLFESDAFLQILNQIPQAQIQYVTKKFFPKLFNFLARRSAKKFFDELLLDGQVTGSRIMTHIGLGEITGFAVNFGLGLARNAAVAGAQGAVGASVGAAVCSLPMFGNIALGAVLVAITGKAVDSLLDFGMNAFEAGMYRDRFAKIEGWLLGTFSPGENQAEWLEQQVAVEAQKDDYSSIQRLIIYIQRIPPLKRGFWEPFVAKLRVPLEFRACQEGSWIAQKYLGILDVLFVQ
ncbi:MAG: hypothetical protein BWY66_01732 [bacterium ADurb.Bin374]|nr:MAG: hypothetical protein BWY66_01732 [bacterium ADurb.Bin374]